jgi:hypothetical protein
MKNKGLCDTCVRWNPKGLGHCVRAKDWVFVAKKWDMEFMISKCPDYLQMSEVFPEEPKVETKAKPKRKKKE